MFRFAKNYWALLQPVTTPVSPCDGLKSTWFSGRTELGTCQRDEGCAIDMTGGREEPKLCEILTPFHAVSNKQTSGVGQEQRGGELHDW